MAVRLTIAELTFAIEAEPEPKPAAWPEVYRPFLNPPSTAGAERVRVDVRAGDPGALPPDAGKLFEGGRAWTVWQAGRARHLVHAPQGSALWQARWADERVAAVEIVARDGLPCPFRYPLDQLVLMYRLAPARGLLVHASGVTLGGRLYVLAGRSGAGKSTSARLLTAAGVGEVLSDDRLVLRERNGQWLGHGTPWPGTERIARAAAAPVAGLLLLEKAPENRIEPLAPAEALRALLPLASILWHERDLVGPMTATAAALLAAVPAYRFAFTPDARAVAALQELAATGPAK